MLRFSPTLWQAIPRQFLHPNLKPSINACERCCWHSTAIRLASDNSSDLTPPSLTHFRFAIAMYAGAPIARAVHSKTCSVVQSTTSSLSSPNTPSMEESRDTSSSPSVASNTCFRTSRCRRRRIAPAMPGARPRGDQRSFNRSPIETNATKKQSVMSSRNVACRQREIAYR